MGYRIVLGEDAKSDLRSLRAFDRQRIGDDIDDQLTDQPAVQTRRRKQMRMEEGTLPFDVPPGWELRVGDLRVYYDVDEESQVVNVRAIRLKPTHRTTKESLDEDTDD